MQPSPIKPNYTAENVAELNLVTLKQENMQLLTIMSTSNSTNYGKQLKVIRISGNVMDAGLKFWTWNVRTLGIAGAI